MDKGTFRSSVKAAANAYAEGHARVMERRKAWAQARAAALDIFREAAKAASEAGGFRLYPHELGDVSVSLRTGKDPTGRKHEGGIEIEREAGMAYSVGQDGSVGLIHMPHVLDEQPGENVVVRVFDDPSELTPDLVRDHVVDFLEWALTTSFRGWTPEQRKRRLGF
ncbi:MAG: hypothetical protein KF729_38770 [Sandaracinaceae bacterium]|nr:hypothetical protein [Sandaracinaceae bacterium]